MTCGVFVFSSVSAPPPSRPPPSLTRSLARSLTHSLMHSLTHSLTHTHSLAHTHHSLIDTHSSLAHSLTHALAFLGLRRSAGGFCVAGAALGALQGVGCTPWRPLVSGGFCVAGAALGALQGVGCTPWRPLVSAALPVAFAWQARHLVLCKGSDVRPVPWSPVAFAWQARHLVLCKGSDVRPGVPWSPPLCRWLLRGTWCSARRRMYALAVSGGFCVAGAALNALQGVGCTPWRPLVSAALPVAFAWQAWHLVLCNAWQARHLVLCKGSDVRPGVPWSPLLCRWLLRGRRGTWCSARGRMYALASLGLRWLLRGRRGVPWSPPLCRWLLRGRRGTWCSASGRRGTWCSARGRIYTLASLGLRWLLRGRRNTSGGFAWQARHLVLCKGLDVRPGVPWSPVAFAWQARHLVLCKGSDVRPGVPWSPPLCRWALRGRRGTWCSARRRMYALAFLGLRWLLRGRRGTWCSARGRMYALASLGLRRSAGGFCVAGAALGALQGVGSYFCLAEF